MKKPKLKQSIRRVLGARTLLVICAVCSTIFVLGSLVVATAAHAQVEIEAELTDCASPCLTEPGAEGELEYDAEFLSDGFTVKEVVFQAVVTIPVPNSLGINATNGRTAGLVVIDLTRLNPSSQLAEPYATCTMVLKKAKATSLTYALKLSGKLKKAQFVTAKKSRGFSDIDIITANVQSGMPAIQDGDVAFVSVNGTDILSSLSSVQPAPPPDTDSGAGWWDY